MPEWTEQNMQDALQIYTDGISINKAADAHRIPRSTFKGQIHGYNPRKEYDKARQKLTPRQEKKLRD
jgi:hypothetical protein